MRKMLFAGAVAGMSLVSSPACAQFSYSDFSSTSGLQLNGSATTAGSGSGTVLRVTSAVGDQSGSVFSSMPITLSDAYSFSTRFTFNLNSQGNGGADGLVFVIQTNSSTVGGSGGGMGYAGLPNSLGVEFDNWYNDTVGNDLNDNHVGIDLGGNISSALQVASPFALDSGTDLTAWIDYNSATQLLDVFLNDPDTRPLTPLLSYSVDLQSVLGGGNEAFVGFTSGTGGSWANHDVLNWDFVDRFAPVGSSVPEPTTWAMMLLGFGAIGWSMRRTRRSFPGHNQSSCYVPC